MSRLTGFTRKKSAVEGAYSLLLRGSSGGRRVRTSFSGDAVHVEGAEDPQEEQSSGAVTIRCRAQNVKVDQSDTGRRSNDTIVYEYRLTFVAVNHSLISGDDAAYKALPDSFIVSLDCDEPPITQWDGEDVEVVNGHYEAEGVMAAQSIVVPKFGRLRLERGNGAGCASVLVLGVALVLLVAWR